MAGCVACFDSISLFILRMRVAREEGHVERHRPRLVAANAKRRGLARLRFERTQDVRRYRFELAYGGLPAATEQLLDLRSLAELTGHRRERRHFDGKLRDSLSWRVGGLVENPLFLVGLVYGR